MRLLTWGILLSTSFGWTLTAQFPQPQLHAVFPPGGQRGSSVEVRVFGADLDALASLSFSDERIQARQKLDGEGKATKEEFIVKIPAEIEVGLFELWASGKFGMSNSRLFAVGKREEKIDDSPEKKMQDALEVPLGVTINGRATANQKNFYRLFAKRGQRVIVVCIGEAIDSKIDPVIQLLDAQGRSLQRDAQGRLLDYTVETTGPLFVAVHDLTYRGGMPFFYRLSIHDGPHVDCVLPLSALPGVEREFHVFGRNLPQGEKSLIAPLSGGFLESVVLRSQTPEKGGASLARLQYSLLGVPNQDGFLYSAFQDADALSQKRIHFSPLHSVIEEEIVSGESKTQFIRPPVAVSGMFYPKRDRDVYEFDAKKGERYRIEVRSHRLGYGTSPLIVVERLDGEGEAVQVLKLAAPYDPGERAFPLRAWDPQGWLEIQESARYRLTISDLFNGTRNRAGLLYELRIRPPSPGFQAFSVSQSTLHRNLNRRAKVESSVLLPGQVLPFRIRLHRIDGFNGSVEVFAETAPKGVRVHSATIPAGDSEGIMLIEADSEAKTTEGKLTLRAKANVGGTLVSQPVEHGQVVWEVGDYNNEAVTTRLTPHRRLAVADGQAFPVSVFAEGNPNQPWRTTASDVLNIPIRVSRLEGFSDNLNFQIQGLKPLLRHPGVSIEKEKNFGALRLDLAKNKLKPGRHEFYLYAEVKGKYSREPGASAKDLTISIYSPPIHIEILSNEKANSEDEF